MATRSFSIVLVALGALVALACSETAVAPGGAPDGASLQASVGPASHRVTVGGPDACTGFGLTPGCDANFSMVAWHGAAGAGGEWHDQYAQFPPIHGIGLHVTVTCLLVLGNEAWIGGVITASRAPELVGLHAITRVVDNGASANDPPDLISFTWEGAPDLCLTAPDLPLFEAPQGQVVVR